MSLVETLVCNLLAAVLLEILVIPTFESCILHFSLLSDLRTSS